MNVVFLSTQNIQPQHLNHCLFISECEEIQGQESPSSAGHRRETAVSTSKRNSKTALYEFLNETEGQSFSVEKESRPSIKMEMNCFVQTGVRGKMLSFIDAAIKTVRPSSIEPERTFSTAGRTQTKVRNRMGPRLLDSIVVLKYHLKNRK